MTTDTSTAPERLHVTWPYGYAETGLAPPKGSEWCTEYVRHDLFDALQDRVEEAEYGVTEMRRQLCNMTAAAQDRHAELDALLAEIERLREALTRIAEYRSQAVAYDDDMGHTRRDFDIGAVIRMESIARAALKQEGGT